MMRICLVLGAGATLSNALHFRSERKRKTRPPLDTTFFEVVDARGISLSPALTTYFRNYLGVEPTASTLREYRMEEVFKDVAYDFRETPNDKVALDAYIDLVDLYLRVLRGTTNWLSGDSRTGGPVGRLLDSAATAGDSLTVITFNHDLVIENELVRRARLRRRWCLDKGYGSASEELHLLYPASNVARFHLHSDDACEHDRPISILKLHGSLNWVVRLNSKRPPAKFLKGEGPAKEIHLLIRREISERQHYARKGAGRKRWDLWPIVVPPVYAKHELRTQILDGVWADAKSALRAADQVLFYGYSLPELDVEAEKLFERALLQNANADWINVVNPASSSAGRFARVSPKRPVRWYPSLDHFFDSGGFIA
jgi:hypothetical protein